MIPCILQALCGSCCGSLGIALGCSLLCKHRIVVLLAYFYYHYYSLIIRDTSVKDVVTFSTTFHPGFFDDLKPFIRAVIGRNSGHLHDYQSGSSHDIF